YALAHDGTVFVASDKSYGDDRATASLLAVRESDGTLLWSDPLPDLRVNELTPLGFGDGDIVLFTFDHVGQDHAPTLGFDAATGHQLWSRSASNFAEKPVVGTNHLFVDANYRLTRVSGVTGGAMWSWSLPQ